MQSLQFPPKRRQLIGAIGQSYTSYLSTINCKSIFLFRFRNLLRNIALNSVGMYVYMVCMYVYDMPYALSVVPDPMHIPTAFRPREL